MKRIKFVVLAAALLAAAGTASASELAMPHAFTPDLGNEASVQRGARNFMNYCSGCHSMKHLRYARMGQDLGIPEDQLKANLMFTSEKPGDHIVSAMPATAVTWFGVQPPDLTVETRMRGPDWVYNYLMTFYTDATRQNGTNNLMLPGAAMPNVLGSLQGVQVMEAAHAAEGGAAAAEGHGGPTFKVVQEGALSEPEFEKFVADTVNFMAYAAEPGRAARTSMGGKVLLYLLVLTAFLYLLKREYWKDVH
ncbi:cytochrome c1 [Sinimarinibacterium sp. CAU 1509]|uniref:cytochrome c1 n=1 Tax=Sinimarinibacterium sp. CAU 1509 TaxID=2562283 RepID=UPI0010AC86E5|nr:cytochrome c1 [Sinimarinibacterium sp. CAU 1509]TJY63032.1 cytochrome c1 [Sinimarinibacterium sp. CAU 1509]